MNTFTKVLTLLLINFILTSCNTLSVPSLPGSLLNEGKCTTKSWAKKMGTKDGKSAQSRYKSLRFFTKKCSEAQLISVNNEYDISYDQALKAFCTPSNITKTTQSWAENGLQLDLEKINRCKDNNSLKYAKKGFSIGSKNFCNLSNLFKLGSRHGYEDINMPDSIENCQKKKKLALRSYLKGRESGVAKLDRENLAEQNEAINEALEKQKAWEREREARERERSTVYYPRGNYKKCELENNSGTIDISFCKDNDNGRIRCYAEVEYEDGSESKIMGQRCVESFSDCWEGKPAAVKPLCAEDN